MTHADKKAPTQSKGLKDGRDGYGDDWGHPKCQKSVSACHHQVCPHTNQSKLSFIEGDMKSWSAIEQDIQKKTD